jgi:hypothetical protein
MLLACLASVRLLAAGASEPAPTFEWDARRGMAALPPVCGHFLGLCDPDTRREIVEYREAYAERLRLLPWLVHDPRPRSDAFGPASNRPTIGWIGLPLRRRLEE